MPLVLLAILVVALLAALCALAFHLAIYALPLMVGLMAFHLTYGAGGGFLLSFLAGGGAALVSITLAVMALRIVKNPIARLAVLILSATPSAIAGYMLVHGVAHAAIPSALMLNTVCGAGGFLVGLAAMRNLNGLSRTTVSQG